MPGKAKIPAPIDRPLSRAYLREFSGWSTAYPPGLSEPTSLRLMENVLVTREGAAQIRPGLRNLTWIHYDSGGIDWIPWDSDLPICSTFEPFYLNDGTKAYLFAYHNDPWVRFGVFAVGDSTHPLVFMNLDEVFLDVDIADITFTSDTNYVKFLQIDNKIIALNDSGDQLRVFYVDDSKVAVKPGLIDRPDWDPLDRVTAFVPVYNDGWMIGAQTTFPDPRTPDGTALISSLPEDNLYNYGFFFTYYNELGESAPSQVKIVKAQRPWSGWIANAALSAPDEEDPRYWLDQLVVRLPRADETEFVTAVGEGAIGAHLYMATWGQNDPVPVEALHVGSREFTDGTGYVDDEEWWNTEGWFQVTAASGQNARTVPMPSLATRRNFTDPSRAGNGIVAADRMVLVNDPTQPAVIRWTSNQQGEYINFTAARGGGLKTLTSGNLQIPAAVVLWQNPQSVDTLTILCRGDDGYSTGYYMAPSEVTSQSESTAIMGFEETSASPGTTSPYGCEVFNNALYHPLEDQLMKSTAANYAIRHKSMTELITHDWQALQDKVRIISSEHDGRIYYIVHNPGGAELEPYCLGNEVWVLDAQAEKPTWSRWLVQGVSLRKIEQGGRIYMALVRPDGIFVFDPAYGQDDLIVGAGEPADADIEQAAISWLLETNTQGANRAHDAWAYLQQAEIVLGNFTGKVEWGLRGKDVYGEPVEISKITQDATAPYEHPWDVADKLLVQRTMKEWFFFARSVVEETVVQSSSGQVSLVQYRYAPSTVNTGYAEGSVETFEYGSNVADGNNATVVNGVPMPQADTERP